MGFTGQIPICHGAPHALSDTSTLVDSEGARLIIEEAMKQDDSPLYAIFLGPLTDIASAYLMEPWLHKISAGNISQRPQENSIQRTVILFHSLFNDQPGAFTVHKG